MTTKSTIERFGITPSYRQSGNLELQLRCLVRFYRAVVAELKSKSGLPWRKRISAWKAGFSSMSWVRFNLDENEPEQYLPDLRTVLKSYKINGFFNSIIGNKLVLARLLASHQLPQPDIVSIIVQGRLIEEDAPFDPNLAHALSRSLERYPHQVFRPTWCGGGEGVFFLCRGDDGLTLNGAEVCLDEVCVFLSKQDRYMATEFQQQAAYASTIYSGSTNAMRILSLWDAENGNPFIASVAHRFGSSRSNGMDHWHQGRGGVCASVDLASATLGMAVSLSANNHLVWESSHPETGEPIEGVVIPGLKECIEGMLKAAAYFPFCPLIGWDVVMTENGFSILEANPMPSLDLIQIHAPLLKDPRSRQFFQNWGLVAGKKSAKRRR